jgi:hypothetical protein
LLNQFATQVKLRDSVHIEQTHGRSAAGRESHNATIGLHGTMLVPHIPAWIEKIDALAGCGINAGEVTSLVKIALRAAPG